MNYWNPAAIHDSTPSTRGVMSDIWAFIIHDTDGHPGGDLEIFRSGHRSDGVTVSIQFYITQKGELYQFMPANVGANHAGVSHMPDGRTGLNDHTIGIELENYPEGSPYSEAMLKQLDNLIHWLDLTFGPKPILGHYDVAPGRKDDPNPPFPMDNYKRFRTHTGVVNVTPSGWYVQVGIFSSLGDANSFKAFVQSLGLTAAQCGSCLVFHASGEKLAKTQAEARKRNVAVCVHGQPWNLIPADKTGVFFTPLATPQTSYEVMK